MSSNVKKLIYWGVYAFLVISGGILVLTKRLPVKSAVIFVFGLYWTWTGIALFCGINPNDSRKDTRESRLVHAATNLGLGITWLILSFTDFSTQLLPMLLAGIPFLIPGLVVFLRRRKKHPSDSNEV